MSSTSIIIPAYNAVKYLQETLASVLSQTRPPDEVIVVDDCSTDGTWEFLQQSSHPRVTTLRNPANQGPGYTRNHGASMAKGTYLAFLDADDSWKPNHLEFVTGRLETFPHVGVGYSRVEYMGERSGLRPAAVRGYPDPEDVFLDNLRGQVDLHPSSIVVKRELYHAIGGFRDIPRNVSGRRVQCEDMDFSIRATAASLVVCSPAASVLYRIHSSQSIQMGNIYLSLLAEYKARLISELRQIGDQRAAAAQEKAVLWWADQLERCWSQRDARALRRLTIAGMRLPIFRRSTLRYLPRSLLVPMMAHIRPD